MLPWAFWSKSLLSTNRPTRYPGLSGLRAYCPPLDRVCRSRSLLSTIRPRRYPGLSGPRAYCLPLDRHATLGIPVQEPTVYRYTSMLPWEFLSKSPLFTIRPTRYLGSSGPRAYCSPLDQHATLGLPIQESTVHHYTNTLPRVFRSKSLLSTANQNNTLGLPVQKPTVYHTTNTLPLVFRSKSLLSTAKQHATLGLTIQEPTVYR
ncbi:hypothetical protein ElyMa_006559400 [Elysia marginata]|uniref:Uncharacterized protein n=1 Tax=Elysia marginata TaxID=1093978 RepID=A0AAV4IAQ9_9GAST|nr:hypothetical protein ElyMa_006559400 [Elysia marginata]